MAPDFIDRLGWSAKIKSIQEELLVFICIGSFTNWGNQFEEVSENNFDLSVVLMSLGHHEEDLTLKSPVITDKDGLQLLMLLNSLLKLYKNKSISTSHIILARGATNNRPD